MPRTAWAKTVYNAYACVKTGDQIYDESGVYLGRASKYKSRCTAKSPGGVELESGQWISGNVENNNGAWYLTGN